MTVRRLNNEDRPQAEAMWRDIFEESPAFASYYFEKRFCPEHAFGAFDGDMLVAMTHGRSTEIMIDGNPYPALLVAGVSTLPAYRKQGLMHKLMTLLIDHAKKSGFSCCYLHPVAESLYASFGFKNGADAMIVRSDETRTHESYDLSERFDAKDMLAVYHALQRTHDGMELRDEEELKVVFADYATEDAKTILAYTDNRPVGYICYSDEGSVFELMALNVSAYASLLDEAAKRAGKEFKAIVPVDCGLPGKRVYSMQYLVFNDAFSLPLKNGFCRLAY
jgi:predicted acetyltransferase